METNIKAQQNNQAPFNPFKDQKELYVVIATA
jgi:hypothetical protein